MKYLICLGPIIGGVIIAIYSVGLSIFYYVKDTRRIKKIHKITYYILIIAEIALILISIIVPLVSEENYLLSGMATGTSYSISDETFRINYKYANRGYRNRIYLTNDELHNLKVECSVEKGNAYLVIKQNNIEKEIDVTDMNSIIDMSEFKEGYISFTLKNKDAKNVKFELIW